MQNLKPEIYRKRLIVEGYYHKSLDEDCLTRFLKGLSEALKMRIIAGPYMFSPDKFSEMHHGLGAFIAWAESGVSFYSWKAYGFFTLDVYSCKPFDVNQVLTYVEDNLECNKLAWSEICYDS